MRPKPDVSGSEVAAFIARGAQAQDAVDALTAPAPAPAPVSERVPKTIRIERVVDAALKREAFERTLAAGRRVTEQDLIDQALRQFFKL